MSKEKAEEEGIEETMIMTFWGEDLFGCFLDKMNQLRRKPPFLSFP